MVTICAMSRINNDHCVAKKKALTASYTVALVHNCTMHSVRAGLATESVNG